MTITFMPGQLLRRSSHDDELELEFWHSDDRNDWRSHGTVRHGDIVYVVGQSCRTTHEFRPMPLMQIIDINGKVGFVSNSSQHWTVIT
jgi:hypothetical protein